MHAFWTAIAPTVTTALVALITAGAGWAVAWLRGRTQRQAQAISMAVAHVEALAFPALELSAAERKETATALVLGALPPSVRPAPGKLDGMIETEVKKQRASEPPGPRY